MIYFNEIDPHAAAWIRQLMADGHIPQGEVDERSIRDVAPDDVRGRTRFHAFAGIAGWELALRLAGWPDDRPVWTGSCPCQPYSPAGKGDGDKDPRNLWPDFFRLIRECRPDAVFGEQVEGAIRHGWLDGVQRDLEGEGYAVGHCVLGAHSAGAPHIRQRIFWVANSGRGGGGRERHELGGAPRETGGEAREQRVRDDPRPGGEPGDMAHAQGQRCLTGRPGEPGDGRAVQSAGLRSAGGVGNADGTGSRQGRPSAAADGHGRPAFADGSTGLWSDFDLLPCRDGKSRRVEPGTFPLANGVSGRMGLLRGYGNAIVPQVAAAFIRAFLETEQE